MAGITQAEYTKRVASLVARNCFSNHATDPENTDKIVLVEFVHQNHYYSSFTKVILSVGMYYNQFLGRYY